MLHKQNLPYEESVSLRIIKTSVETNLQSSTHRHELGPRENLLGL